MAGARTRKKRNARHRLSMFAIILVVIFLLAFLSVKTLRLRARVNEYDERVARLEEEIADEEARGEELDEREIYIQTKQYVEQIARDRLGLVYPGEILLVPQQ
ncbi:MAG: septum formation initiator family protein [Lachnospiraceae bacterium]|nr:septum formation initiator family protein [Lachnospiraceae bacterium]